MNIRPLGDRLLVQRIEEPSKTPGGILLPDNAKEKPTEGKVLAVGPGTRDSQGTLHPVDVDVGDRVLFTKWSGTETKTGSELIIIRESDVLGVIL